MKIFLYIFKKILILFYSFKYSKYKIKQNIFYLKKEENKNKKVLFYFPNNEIMHLGDHLFFEPICRLFIENDFEVEVSPTKTMEVYFKQLNYKIQSNQNFVNYDLIVSSSRFIIELRKLNKNVLLIETECSEITKPLIDDSIEKIISILNLKKTVSPIPGYITHDLNILKKFNIHEYGKFVVYSNYLVSGSFRVFNNKYRMLEKAIQEFKTNNPDFKIIHIGSEKDKKNDKKKYDYVDIDLRGKTSLIDLFDLCNNENVLLYFGFDNFLMHLFFIKNKNVNIMSRGRWSKKSRYFLNNYIDPPYNISNYKGIKKYIK